MGELELRPLRAEGRCWATVTFNFPWWHDSSFSSFHNHSQPWKHSRLQAAQWVKATYSQTDLKWQGKSQDFHFHIAVDLTLMALDHLKPEWVDDWLGRSRQFISIFPGKQNACRLPYRKAHPHTTVEGFPCPKEQCWTALGPFNPENGTIALAFLSACRRLQWRRGHLQLGRRRQEPVW